MLVTITLLCIVGLFVILFLAHVNTNNQHCRSCLSTNISKWEKTSLFFQQRECRDCGWTEEKSY